MGQIPTGEQLFELLPSPLCVGAKYIRAAHVDPLRFGRGYLARPPVLVHDGAAEAASPFDWTFIVFP
jgi:hypothetical protein